MLGQGYLSFLKSKVPAAISGRLGAIGYIAAKRVSEHPTISSQSMEVHVLLFLRFVLPLVFLKHLSPE